MPTINAGATANFSIPAGQVATISGSGVAVLVSPTSSPIQIINKGVIGPYEVSRVVTMYAQTALDYNVALPVVAGNSANLGVLNKPAINTPVIAGQTATSTFSFVGNPVPTTAIQWVLDGTNISGATANTYLSSFSDSGKSLQVRVTASNSFGTLTSTSDAVTVSSGGSGSATAFDPTVAYSAGDSVIYAGSQYQFTSPHPAGNWIGSDATYQSYVSGVANTWGVYKQLGNQDDFLSGNIAAADVPSPTNSSGGKLQVEAPWTRARMAVLQREGRYKRGEQFSIASSESAAINSLSAAYDVVVGGVASSVLYNASTAPQGFRRITWGGQPASPVQIPAMVTLPSQGHTAISSYEFSDIIPSLSVPPATGVRPFMVWRESRITMVGDQSSSARNTRLIGNYNKYSGGQVYGRLALNQQIGTSGDMVADPTLAKSGTMLNPASAGSWPNVMFQLDHGVPTRVLGVFGDSISEAYNWIIDAVNTISTPAAPFTLFNNGESGDASAQYLAALRLLIREPRFQFTDIIVPTFSPNEPTGQTDTTTGVLETALMDTINACVARGIRVYVWTSYSATTSRFSGNPTAVAAIQAYNQRMRVRAAAANAPFKLVEIETGFDVSTMVSDGTHPNSTGQDFMRGRLVPALQRT